MACGVLRVGGVRLGERGLRLPRPAEVEQGHRPVVQPVGPVHGGVLRPARIRAGNLPCVHLGQLPGHRRQVVGPLLDALAQTAFQQVRECSRHRGHRGVGRRAQPVRGERGPGGGPHAPRHRPGEHLQHADREAPHIGATAQGRAPHLLGRGVRGRHPAVRDQKRGCCPAGCCPVGHSARGRRPGAEVPGPREPEVGDLRGALPVEQHVARLDVLVHHPAEVGVRQPARHLDGDVQDPAHHLVACSPVEPALVDRLAQASAVHVLREHPRHPADRAHVVTSAQVRMEFQPHPRLRLADEPFLVRLVPEELRTRTLDGEIGAPRHGRLPR
ncbi:hypothetical protein SCANM63S_05621 [Streptomyces canarius]